MKSRPYLRLWILAAAVLGVPGGWMTLRGQDNDDLKRAVARISLMEGEVSVRRGDSGEWVAGVVNAPLLADDRISTSPNSRAEVQLDAGNVLRIGGNAEVRLAQLEYGRYQMEIAHGTVTYAVVRASGADVELDTPSVSVRPSRVGVYRISVNESGETQVAARSGEVEVFTPRGTQWVNSGQMMVARGNPSDPEYQIVAAYPYDDWDRWNDSRDRMLTQSTSYQYVPQGVYGAEELDANGTWGNVEPYGYCWRPTVMVDAGWAPYRRGRWVWEDWYGWTWVSYDPWGWAPYHYGRWFWNTGHWWWYPGVLGRQHYWSPALVGFFGWGHGGVGFGFGNVGWVPLAPYETFHPWWGRGYYGRGGYVNRSVNYANVNVTNVYRNARVANGISGVSAGDFQAGRFHNVGRFSGDQVREAGLIRGQMPIRPSASNLRFADRSPAFTPASRENVRFFSRQQPNRVERVPFSQQQRAFDQGGARGAPGVSQTPGRLSQASGGFRGQEAPAGVAPRSTQNPGANGWRRFGGAAPGGGAPQANAIPQNRGTAEAAPRNDRPAQSNRGGWQRFGEPGNAPRSNFNAAPRSNGQPSGSGFGGSGGSRYSSPRGTQEPMRVSPPVVRERQAPQRSYEAPRSYQAPQQPRSYQPPQSYAAPRYSAPRSYSPPQGGGYSAPRSYSAPRGGGGGYSAPRGNNDRGSGHSSGGGNRGAGGPRGRR